MNRKTIILFSALVLAGLVVLVVQWRSEKPSADSAEAHLQVALPGVLDSENAFTYLDKAAAGIFWPRTKERAITSIADDKTWDPAFVEELLIQNERTFAASAQAMRCRTLRIPPVRQLNEEDEFAYLLDWRKIARLHSIRAAAFSRSGREKEAFEEAMTIVRLGHLMENSGGPIIHYMRSAAVKWIGLERLRKLNAGTTLPCSDLSRWILELNQYRANEAGLSNAITAEYQLTLKWFDDLRLGKAGPTNSGLAQMAYTVGTSPLLNIRKTRRLFITAANSYLRSVPRNFSQMEAPQRKPPITSSRLKRFLRGNALGEILNAMIEPAWKGALVSKCRENVNVSVTQTLLALKCWQREHGRLPPNLESLVPDWLAEVPRDDFDGKQLRYHPAKKVIYSVGKDLLDAGGVKMAPTGELLDITFDIEF